MDKLKDIREIKHDIIDAVKAEVAKGLCEASTEELGAAIDMVKDLAKAEKDCMEACYYEKIVEEMDDDEGERYGYDRWRYASGRFAPKGRGSYGYVPMTMEMPRDMPPGEPEGRSDGRSGVRYGYHGDMDSKEPSERLDGAIDVMGEIWGDADKELRGKMRSAVKDLLYQMEQAG